MYFFMFYKEKVDDEWLGQLKNILLFVYMFSHAMCHDDNAGTSFMFSPILNHH